MAYEILTQQILQLAASLKNSSGAVLSTIMGFGAGLCLAVMPVDAQESSDVACSGIRPLVSIKHLMEKTITPATNTLWNAFELPATDDQWVVLEEAAVTVLVAAQVNAFGGAGPMDNEWVKQPGWKVFNQELIDAGLAALEAIRARDHEALLKASDALYPPCEGCHRQFNPGVVKPE